MVKHNSIKAWILASRPKTLSGALMPVMLATALAFHDGEPRLLTALLCMFFACSMQVAANFVNDWYDCKKGTDREDRLGPERACAQGWISLEAMKKGIIVVLFIACIAGLAAMFLEMNMLVMRGWEIVAVGLLCVVFCILYTTHLSYLGLGDVLVVVFFGFVPVCGTYYLLLHQLTATVFIIGLSSGLSIDTLLIVNNYRDRVQDAISGKRTIVVRFGETFGHYAFLFAGLIAGILSLSLCLNDQFKPLPILFASALYLALHIATWREMVQINQGKILNSILGKNSRNMLLFGIFLSIAILFFGT